MSHTICIFGTTKPSAPRDTICIEGLKLHGYAVIECLDSTPSFFKYWNVIKKHSALKHSYDVLYIPYSNLLAVPLARLISRKKIIFNALSPLYESVVLDRGRHSKYSPAGFWYWLLDFVAFHSAHLTLLETDAQIDFVSKTFFISKGRCKRVWTSADETLFAPDPRVPKAATFTVVFRGYFLPFVGAEKIIEAAKLLKNQDIDFHIMGRGYLKEKIKKLVEEARSLHIKLDIGFLDETYLIKSLQEAHVSLGQFSSLPRGQRTISHKTFESLALGLPFITVDSKSTRELLKEDVHCMYTKADDARDLADKILVLKNDPSLQATMGNNNRKLFTEKLTASAIGADLAVSIDTLIKNDSR